MPGNMRLARPRCRRSFIILVRKGYGPRYIQHEMLHIFENYLGLKPGTLEKENLDLWARERSKTK